MPLVKITIPPGIRSNGTAYQNRGRWAFGTLMRFHEGDVTPIGGWAPLVDPLTSNPVALEGVARNAIAWRGSTGGGFLAFGTVEKLYAYIDSLHDITPLVFTQGNPDSILTSGGANYGDGNYGALTYGQGIASAGDQIDGDVWTLDTFGNFLVGSMFPSDNNLYVWQNDINILADIAPNSPSASRGVFVTAERFLVALGADGNERRVQWADRETIDVWVPTPQNQAGDFDLEGPGRIMAGRRSRGESLIWTDFSLYSMTFVGGPAVYGFQKRGLECGLTAPNAVAATPSGFAWMGTRSFFQYDGYVRPLESEVGQLVFETMNQTQRYKIFAVTNREFNEITWHFPGSGAMENNFYVTWNYVEDTWTFGNLSRTAAVDSHPVLGFPVAIDGEKDINGEYLVWLHENGFDRKNSLGETSFPPFLESAPFEIGEGDRFVHVLQIYPDIEEAVTDAEVTFVVADYPQATERRFGPFSLANPTDVRFNARQVKLFVQQTIPDGVPLWRLGDLRLDVRAGGKR